jgi:hypothetical protein
VYGPVRTVVWEDGGREAPSYPIGILRVLRVLIAAGVGVWYTGSRTLDSRRQSNDHSGLYSCSSQRG